MTSGATDRNVEETEDRNRQRKVQNPYSSAIYHRCNKATRQPSRMGRAKIVISMIFLALMQILAVGTPSASHIRRLMKLDPR